VTSKQKGDTPLDPALRQVLTPAQFAEAERFADERIQAQLSTEPVDERQAETWLRQAYQVAGLAAPQRIHWLDGPHQLVAALAPRSVETSVVDRILSSVVDRVRSHVYYADVWNRVGERVEASVGEHVQDSVRENIEASVGERVQYSVWESIRFSVRAYENASWLASYQFLAGYLAPHALPLLHALARFNEQVSGYWLGEEAALVVRRPRLLCRDEVGRLHCAAGKAIEYRDGWGFYAWHGVRVPEQVILAPERLSREDFVNEPNVEVRRVMQERMGGRFVSELGGVVLDTGLRGTLYEVRLPKDDPEQVARYVQVQDASSKRGYFVRVPPTIQTAAEAVAWSFQLTVEGYHPAQET